MKATVILCGLLALGTLAAAAADRTFTVVTNAAVQNHWPSADRLVGTADDVVNAGLSTYGRSSPNQFGTYSYIVTSFGLSPAPDPLLFGNYDTVTFVLGSATIDTSSFVTNDIPLVKDLQLSGTELFPGHGPYRLKLTNRRGGSYTHVGSLYTFTSRYDFEGTFAAGQAVTTNALAEGRVAVIDAQDFGAPDLTGVPDNLAAFIRSVGLPIAQQSHSSGLLCGDMNLQTAGSLPGTSGFFPPLTGYAFVLALDFSGVAELRITSIQALAEGTRLQWTPLTGATYSVEATDSLEKPFASIAAGLVQTEYLDAGAKGQTRRYYRLRAL